MRNWHFIQQFSPWGIDVQNRIACLEEGGGVMWLNPRRHSSYYSFYFLWRKETTHFAYTVTSMHRMSATSSSDQIPALIFVMKRQCVFCEADIDKCPISQGQNNESGKAGENEAT